MNTTKEQRSDARVAITRILLDAPGEHLDLVRLYDAYDDLDEAVATAERLRECIEKYRRACNAACSDWDVFEGERVGHILVRALTANPR